MPRSSIIAGQSEHNLGGSFRINPFRRGSGVYEGDAFTVARGVVEATDRGSDLINLIGSDFSSRF